MARKAGEKSHGGPAWAARSLDEAAAALPSVWLKSPSMYPILYRKRIDRVDDAARGGDLVAVYLGDNELVGYGLYNPRSEILVRMVKYGGDPPDAAFWRQRLTNAVQLRREVLQLDKVANAYRVVHAEGDQLSGLVIDRYANVLSAEAYSLGMYQRAEAVLGELAAMAGTEHWVLRPSPQFLSQEGCSPIGASSPNVPDRVVVQEYGTKFFVHFADGHKTGFFCDQRENRRKLAELCAGKSVLDLCCYTGGFAIQAAVLGGAAEVTGVDLDAEPLELAKQNARLNRVKINFVQSDAFAYMRDMLRNGRTYDVVVLDPPKLIRSRAEIEEGTARHYDLSKVAMQLVKPGGWLLSCSCAGLLPEPEFVRLLCSAARNARPQAEAGNPKSPGRNIQIVSRTGASPDHPVAGNYLESDYLKAVWMIVN